MNPGLRGVLIGFVSVVLTRNVLCERSSEMSMGSRHGRVSHEHNLLTALLGSKESTQHFRPLYNSSQAINVSLGITITQIIRLNEKEGKLTTQIWKQMMWYDEFLSFDQDDYGGIERVAISPSNLWTPDIMLYNNNDKDRPGSEVEAQVMVYPSGKVLWNKPIIYTSACRLDFNNFPFDSQSCTLKFASWVYDTSQMKLELISENFYKKGIDLSQFVTGGEWDLEDVSVTEENVVYILEETEFQHLNFHLKLHRKPGFFSYVLILPSIVLSSMLLFVYWVPPQRPDRTSLGMAICSAFFVLLLVVVGETPPSAETRLGKFCAINIVACGFVVLTSIFLVNVTTMRHRMTSITRKVFVHWLNDTLCVCADKDSAITSEATEMNEGGRERGEKSAREEIRREEWNILALVINRILFIFHLFVLLFAIIFILPWPHRNFELITIT